MEAIVAEGFERIHRTNLIGMGVLPLEFKPGTTRLTQLDGTEAYDVIGTRKPRADLTLVFSARTVSGWKCQSPAASTARRSVDL